MSVGKINLIRYCVMEASRPKNLWGKCSWIGVMETKTSREPENS